MKEFIKANELIKKSKSIAIVGHIRPDGDAIGTAIALSLYKDADIYFDGDIPKSMDYLKNFDKIQNEYIEKEYDLLIIVDVNQLSRIGIFLPLVQHSKKIVCFDHHKGFDIDNADVVISEPNTAATGEIVYDFFKSQDIKITKDMADALYTAISTDTGCYLFPSTTPHTHLVTADLISLGADIENINYINFRVYGQHMTIGLKQILRDFHFKHNGEICYTVLKNSKNYDTAEKSKFKLYVSNIRGVKVSVLISQENKSDGYNVSLRSIGGYDVETVAKKFDGGGHKNAAGFTFCGKYKKLIKLLIAEIEKIL